MPADAEVASRPGGALRPAPPRARPAAAPPRRGDGAWLRLTLPARLELGTMRTRPIGPQPLLQTSREAALRCLAPDVVPMDDAPDDKGDRRTADATGMQRANGRNRDTSRPARPRAGVVRRAAWAMRQ
jgi:hypothetical protein